MPTIYTHAPHTAAVERVEILVGETFVDNGNTTIALGIGGDAIEHRSIISAVTTCLHDYGTFNAKVRRVQGRQRLLLRRISRRIAPVCCIGKFRGRAKDVAMGIAAACWQLEARLATMVEKSCVDVHGLALAKRSRRHNPRLYSRQIASRPLRRRLIPELGEPCAGNRSRIPAINVW